jgi:hypothetical protein
VTSPFVRWFALTFVAVSAMLAALGVLVMLLIAPPPLKTVRTTKFEMRLAKGWHCDQEGGEYVCSPEDSARDALGVFAMKRRGKGDSLKSYREYLSKPKNWINKAQGRQHTSQVRSLGRARLAGHDWISSLHYESELPGYFTAYWGTVTSDVGILVTFSARKDAYERRRKEFETMFDSLMVYQL